MSSRTRNQMIYDENSNANAKRGRYNTRSAANKQGIKSGLGGSRRALGDISNARKEYKSSKGIKKVRAKPLGPVGGDTRKTVKPQPSRSFSTRSVRKSTRKKTRAGVCEVQQEVDDLSISSMEIEEDVKKEAEIKFCAADLRDMKDPQMVVEYIQDIMEYLKSIEGRFRAKANYMYRQRDINSRMREILIDWLNEVHLKFKLRIETLYLTVNLIDRFLSLRSVTRTRLQLVGCTAMLIASKYEEIFAPEVRDFEYISDRAYNREQILLMESAMLSALKFDLTVAYPLRFLQRYVHVMEIEGTEFNNMANFLTELTLQKIEFLKYLPSMIAASATSLALELLQHKPWCPLLEKESGYALSDLTDCRRALHKLVMDPLPKYTAVRKKYMLPKYDEVADIALDNGEDIEI